MRLSWNRWRFWLEYAGSKVTRKVSDRAKASIYHIFHLFHYLRFFVVLFSQKSKRPNSILGKFKEKYCEGN